MFSGETNHAKLRGWIKVLLLPFALLLLSAVPALAEDCVGFYGGVIDGNFVRPAPSQIQIDGNCTIKNFTGTNPLSSNISFYTSPGQNQERWLVIFDNVEHTGQMSCNSVQGHKIWFTNGSSTGIHANCQNLFIPVEKINKQNPAGQTTATIGVPFTYTLRIPVLYDPLTGSTVNNNGSPNDLHSIIVTDDLNATGASLSYVSHTVTWVTSGAAVPHTFTNVGGLLTWSNFPVVPAGQQFVINLTVVLNNTGTNTPGLPFINTAKWEFGRLIDGTFYQPLPGEWGVTPPMTIAAPVVNVDKTGPATMNLGQWGDFVINAQNAGLSDAWNVTLSDQLPSGATGGMCERTPEIQSVQVFASDGVTPVPGKGPLALGSGYSMSYSGVPTCRLDLTILSAAGRIGPNERLIVRYRTQLDSNTQNNVALTNVAGATLWFNGDASNPARVAVNKNLSNGTPGVLDWEDDHTVTTALTGYFFEKTVADQTTGVSPATTAGPGDRLRYTLRLRNIDQALNNFRIVDDLGAMNPQPAFTPGTLTLVSYPPGADVSNTNPSGGTNGAGIIDIRNLSVPAGGQITIQFDITLRPTLTNGAVVTNQSALRLSTGALFANSDDPNVNGTASPTVAGDEDPTRLTIVSAPAFRIQKISTDLTDDPNALFPGDTLRYTITVKNIGNAAATNVTLRDAVPANTTYVAGSTTMNGTPVPDSGGTSPLVAGMLINSPADATPGSMPADASSNPANVSTVTFNVVVNAGVAGGTVISNQGFVSAPAGGIVNQPSDDPDTPTVNDPTNDTVGNSDYIFEKTVANMTSGVNPATTAAPGDRLRYTLRFRTVAQPHTNFRIFDDLGALNPQPVFAPGTLALVSYPPGADISNTNATGGTNGTGVIDVRNLSVAANSEVVIQFDITLRSPLANGTVVTNQSTMRLASGTVFATSDNPNVNGPASPTVAGDEDPTRVTIASAPIFLAQKISTDLTGDPNILLAGETLRYTITVKNTGNANATNVVLRDVVPANTTYVAGSTTLNGAAVPDSGGTSPLVAGLLINSPADPTPGLMPADASSNTANVATVTFNVVVNAGVPTATVISNQGFVTAAANGITDQPTDDPDTTIANDPTLDIVGNSGYIFEKTVTNMTSGVSPATTAAPGDRLRYTLRFRTIDQALNGFRIFDDVGALNSQPVFVAGTLALVTYPAGADISNTSGTGGTNGTGLIDVRNMTVAAQGEVVIQFDITLPATIPNGTVVSNQSALRLASGAPFAMSDDPNVNGPADPAVAGDEDPTRVTIASTPVFFVQKISTDLTGDPNALFAGDTLRYTITARNVGTGIATNVVLRDVIPANTTYVANSTTLNGNAVADSGGTSALVNGMLINSPANTTPGSMPAPAAGNNVATITFDVVVNAGVPAGTVISNQGFLTAPDNGITNQPSDDPDTAAANDPTLDVIGNPGYIFEKTVGNLTSGVTPATTAAPGDRLRYTLRFRTLDQAHTNATIFDDLGALNSQPVFAPGTLALVTYPAGANISNTNGTGGTSGTGVIDVRNLSVAANTEVVIQFDITLAAALNNGTVVTNQSTFRLASGAVFATSDDPNVNGAADPTVAGDEDPTRVTISSAPAFLVQKISTDLTGDPNVLLGGDTLRYTITVRNIGNGNATNVVLRDLIPTNTTYVAGSTTLNGATVADSGGTSPLVNGMPINSPANPTPGTMPAGAGSQNNIATITFRVVVSPNVVNGTVISNQGFVTAIDNGIVDHPSDDPDTPLANDPTRDVVGSLPLLYAEKRVVLSVDLGSPGIVDPGDTLRYTITVQNSSQIAATGVFLRDSVPANTTYVANTTVLNGQPVGQPDGGVSPLASGVNVGTVSPGASATLQFELRVNAGTPAGTVISNQAVVDSVELPDVRTDGDGNPGTGPEPTVVVVGGGQQLSITKQVTVIGGGSALPGSQLEYIVRAVNIAGVPAINTVITDNLDASQPGQIIYVSGSATMNGSATGVTFSGSTITADYAAVSGALDPGAAVVLRFRATLASNLADGTVVTNTGVVAWNSPAQTASASASVVVGGVPGFAVVNGSLWHDADFDDAQDPSERALAGWAVDLYLGTQLVHTATTDTAGAYRIIGVEPGSTYEILFRAPGAGANTATLGRAVSPFTNGPQRITNIVVTAGANLQGLNLPIHPNGVVYNSLSRTPIAGATLTLLDAVSSSPLPASCFDDPAQQGQISLGDGYYKFDINFSSPSCPNGGSYLIGLTPPPMYGTGYSQIIPATSSAATAAFSVPSCPATLNDAIPGTASYCEAQTSEFAPAASVPARSAGTTYHVHLALNGSQIPGSSQIFNNHIPLDPQFSGTMSITKTTPMLNVTRGQLVPYVITVNNLASMALTDVTIVDRFPAGFTYVAGSAVLDGVATEPSVSLADRTLSWNGLGIAATQSRTVRLLLVVGAGVSEGEFVNRAQTMNGFTGNAMSGEATATVRIVPDPTFDCTDVTGKIFNDANRNGLQDEGENGLPGVRVVSARGLAATTDQYGRYHITCAITPNETRGSNFVLKLDDRTLPSGFRLTTDQLQIKHVTRGKAIRFNFGAAIHRVIGIDLSDDVFEPGKTEIRVQWRPRMDMLLEEMRKSPAVLRLSYIADNEDPALVERRVEAIKRQLTKAWAVTNKKDVLTIEPEVFWRRGAPAKRLDLRPESR